MKNGWKRCLIVVAAFLIYASLFIACWKVPHVKYYTLNDFSDITIGESTYEDVYDTLSSGTMVFASYGGYCDYPKEDGGVIRIKYYGADLIVGDISEIP